MPVGILKTMSDRRVLEVPAGLDGLRVDVAISRLFGLSRTAAARLVDDGQATVDGSAPSRSDRISGGARLEVDLPGPREPVAAVLDRAGLVVLHEDADIVVVEKPAGLATHPSPGWTGPTVTGALAGLGYQLATSGAAERQGVVHRLDVGTSGVMVLARSESAYSTLKSAFRDRRVDKRYHAIVQGHLDPLRGTIDAPVDRHPSHEYKFAVVAGGRPAVTHYDTVEAFHRASLAAVRLETGRTHQIRVHFAAVCHPCVGDLVYGADPVLAHDLAMERQALHAVRLAFSHPRDDRPVEFESSYPADFDNALNRLRGDA